MRVGVATDHGLSDPNECLQWPVFVSCPLRPWRFSAISSAVCSHSIWISGGKEFK